LQNSLTLLNQQHWTIANLFIYLFFLMWLLRLEMYYSTQRYTGSVEDEYLIVCTI
jgi:hypothetical protein